MTLLLEKSAADKDEEAAQKALQQWFSTQNPDDWRRNATIAAGVGGAGIGALSGWLGSDPGESTRTRTKRILRDALLGGALGSGGGYLAYRGADDVLKGTTGKDVFQTVKAGLGGGPPPEERSILSSIPARLLYTGGANLLARWLGKSKTQAGTLSSLLGSPARAKAFENLLLPYRAGTNVFLANPDGTVSAGVRPRGGGGAKTIAELDKLKEKLLGENADKLFDPKHAGEYMKELRRRLLGSGKVDATAAMDIVRAVKEFNPHLASADESARRFLRQLGVNYDSNTGSFERRNRLADMLSRSANPVTHYGTSSGAGRFLRRVSGLGGMGGAFFLPNIIDSITPAGGYIFKPFRPEPSQTTIGKAVDFTFQPVL